MPNTQGKATDFFAPPAYRRGQKESIEEIERAFQEYDFVLFEGPTGSGKSQIARAFAFQSGDAYIITPQKILQDQYERDFPEMKIVKGRSAYSCLAPDGGTCARGPCRKRKGFSHGDCPYTEAKDAGLKAPVAVYNFDSFYYQIVLPKKEDRELLRRELLIIDEAHNTENKFLDFMTLSLSNKRRYFPIEEFKRLEDYDPFIAERYQECQNRIGELNRKLYLQEEISEAEADELEDLLRRQTKFAIYLNNRERIDPPPAEYVFKYEDRGNYQTLTFRPIFVDDFIERKLFPYAEKFLMMSATILDKKNFCRNTGLDPNEVCYIQQSSNFPSKNYPISKKYIGKMSHKFIKENIKKIPSAVEEILEMHPNQKGIIQTHNEKIAQYIKAHCLNPRLTFNKDHSTPMEMLKIHREKAGSFIVASGLKEGLDLKGDLSEVQVFCKVPYPDLGDKRVRRRMELQEGWFEYMTAVMFIQSFGRSIRSEKEQITTYILDTGFGWFYFRNYKLFPEHIRQAIAAGDKIQKH